MLLITVVAVAFSLHERNVARHLANQNQAMNATLNANRDQLSALTAKLNATEEKPSPANATTSHAGLYQKPLRAATLRHRIDDPRWKKVQGQLDEQGKQIESTRQDLADTRTELQGSIARTHDELVTLEKKGERNYYEFDLGKSSQFERQGPVSVRLRKANTRSAGRSKNEHNQRRRWANCFPRAAAATTARAAQELSRQSCTGLMTRTTSAQSAPATVKEECLRTRLEPLSRGALPIRLSP